MPAWRCSVTEKRVTLAAFFLMLTWPVYLTVSLGPINITPARIMSALAIVVVSLFILVFQHRTLQFIQVVSKNPVMMATFVVYLIWRLISDAVGTDPPSSFLLTILDLVSSGFFLITLMAVAMSSSRAIIEAIFWADLIFIVVGMFELVAGYSVAPFLTHFSSMSPDLLAAYAIDNYRGDIFRVRALSSHPILFGSYIAAVIPVLLHLRVNGRRIEIRILSVVLLALSPLMLIASNARSALAGAAVALFCFYALRAIRVGRRDPKFLALIFVVGTVAITGALATSAASGGLDAANQLIAGRDKIERSSSEARMEMLDRGTNALQERPIAGYGDGQASIVAGLRGIHNIVTIDSYFLAVALNFGIPGLIINVLFFITILRAGYIASTRPGLNADQSGISALTAASVCILLCAITVTSSEYFIIIYALGATAATAFARPRRNR
jgi:hypothetical protein